jgi:hypothetical protein
MIGRSDLVSLYRRKTPGLGIVLRRCPDALGLMEREETYQTFVEMYHQTNHWRSRHAACDYLMKMSALDSELVLAFLRYNTLYTKQGLTDPQRMKRDFVQVKWFSKPSAYEQARLKEETSWLPTDWFRKVK